MKLAHTKQTFNVMSNPFLFDEPEESGDAQTEAYSNPFLQEAPAEDGYVADNPFLSQQAQNPFFGNDENSVNDAVNPNTVADKPLPEQIDSAMSFFGTTITDGDEDDVESHTANSTTDEPKKGPPPRPSPPTCPQATQDLISSLADHLDQTSSHLLDRIPVTRTPSPVSIRDLHSPSPTPDVADLLDVSENVNQNDGLFISHPDDGSNGHVQSDNPFVEFDDVAPLPPAPTASIDPVAPVQTRVAPPPPRPIPPRPTPPRRPSPPTQTPPQSQPVTAAAPKEADLFDMFGTNTGAKQQANIPKSNQDILSLFAAPKVSAPAEQQDLLTSDIFSMSNVEENTALPPVFSDIAAKSAATFESAPDDIIQQATTNPLAMDQIDSHPPDQTAATTVTSVNEPIVLDFTADIEKCESLSDNSSAIGSTMSRTPEVSTPFYVPGGYIENRGQSPVSHGEIAYAYNEELVTAIPTNANLPSNPFGSPEQPAIPIINHHIETAPIINKTDDEFDAFSAKFNSASNIGGDAFGSGYKSPAPPTDGKLIDWKIGDWRAEM